jgi:NitT/TauT family transport system ATP-binding protein
MTVTPEVIRRSHSAPAVDLREVHKTFRRRGGGTLDLFADLSLTVQGGEFVTIVGPSGCGKTTLLKLIAGLTPPTQGQIRFVPPAPKPRLGIVFQDYTNALAPWRTVLRNVELGLEIEGCPRNVRRERARHHLERVGLAAFESAYPWELSGGMQQRVQIARVLAYEPTVLLMDEPFGSLDAQMRRILQHDLLEYLDVANRPTVIFVTHDIDEALYLGDRVVVLSGRPSTVLRDFDQASRPHDHEQFLRSPGLIERRQELWEALRAELR